MQLRAMIKSSQNVHYIELSNFVGGESSRRARMRIAHYRVTRFSFASGTEAS